MTADTCYIKLIKYGNYKKKNATAEANPSVTKFSKEQNDLKMKELKEYSSNNEAGQYDLNLHVLGLNKMKGYLSMARIFHPDNNYGFDITKIMTMINTARDGLRDQLRENDEFREEDSVQAAIGES